jgi:putative two-component system response regulator
MLWNRLIGANVGIPVGAHRTKFISGSKRYKFSNVTSFAQVASVVSGAAGSLLGTRPRRTQAYRCNSCALSTKRIDFSLDPTISIHMGVSMEAIDSLSATLAVPANKGTIMVVDDNPANLKLMEDMLRPCGYKVGSFPRGRLALAAASDSAPDLILLDIDMPEMTGYEVCERFKSTPRLSEIPVIFLSALDALSDRLRGFQAGGVDYVSKPFLFEEVQARVAVHLRLRHLQQEVERENCHLQEKVEIQVKKTAEAQMETIFAIAKLAEARDGETGRHLERVQAFCMLLATGLSEYPRFKTIIDSAWLSNVFHASPLHDIGKVAIPDRILLSPGKLTSEEFAVMKTHTIVGAQTLRSVHQRFPDNTFTAMGIEIAQSHHEWWDGTGYPDGLAGEEIPLCARILAVADCYDAIRSKRCYKPAISHDEACAIILRNSAKHFDPAVTAVFSVLAETFRDVGKRMDTGLDGGADGGKKLQNQALMALAKHVST